MIGMAAGANDQSACSKMDQSAKSDPPPTCQEQECLFELSKADCSSFSYILFSDDIIEAVLSAGNKAACFKMDWSSKTRSTCKELALAAPTEAAPAPYPISTFVR
jgi:hypothetical protein